MLTCPNPPCRKPVPPGARECPRCRTDLSLLMTYVNDLGENSVSSFFLY
jgi:hypothetical protein